MILYKQRPFPFKMKNVMLLDIEGSEKVYGEEPVVYVSKNTYDQCVSLYARLDGKLDVLCSILKVNCSENSAVNWFYEKAPEPINILAPFLAVITATSHVEIEEENIEQMFGYLHIASQVVNFDGYTTVPVEVRANIKLGRSILTSYKESWSDLESSLYDRVPVGLREVAGDISSDDKSENIGQTVDLKNEALFDNMDDLSEEDFVARMDALFEQASAEAEEETQVITNNTVPASASIPAPVPEVSVPADEPEKVDDISASMHKYI